MGKTGTDHGPFDRFCPWAARPQVVALGLIVDGPSPTQHSRSRERGPKVPVGPGSEAGRIGDQPAWNRASGSAVEQRGGAIRRTFQGLKGLASNLSLEEKCELEWYERTQENLRASTQREDDR